MISRLDFSTFQCEKYFMICPPPSPRTLVKTHTHTPRISPELLGWLPGCLAGSYLRLRVVQRSVDFTSASSSEHLHALLLLLLRLLFLSLFCYLFYLLLLPFFLVAIFYALALDFSSKANKIFDNTHTYTHTHITQKALIG